MERSHFHRAGLNFDDQAVSGEQSAGDLEFGQSRWRPVAVFLDDGQNRLHKLNELLALEPFLDVIVWSKQEDEIGGDSIPSWIIPSFGR